MKRLFSFVLAALFVVSLCLTSLAAVPFSEAAPAAPATAVKFAAVGDYGINNPNELAVANLIKSWSPEFVITVGDNSYGSASPVAPAVSTIDQNVGKYYSQFIGNYTGGFPPGAATNQFFPTIGNHEYSDGGGINAYLNYFTLPNNERYYDFVQGPVHFFALNSDTNEPDGTSSSSTQGLWLQNGLQNSTSRWNIVYFHHAPYSSSSTHGNSTWMQWPFQAWGADAVLAGHVHNYERLDKNGLPYFVNGSGGNSLYGWKATPEPGSVVRDNTNYGAMLIEANDTDLTFKFYAVASGGTLIDTYTLTNSSPTQTLPINTGSTWKYLDNGSNQGTAWRDITFDDSTWPSGPAELGYGDSAEGRPEATVVNCGPGAPTCNANNYITTYFRRGFIVADRSIYSALNLRLMRDDGAVVYLNGTEIWRTNMPTGSVSYTTVASAAISGSDETTFVSPPATLANTLVNGTNVLAVEIHQSGATSTDISFDLELTGVMAPTGLVCESFNSYTAGSRIGAYQGWYDGGALNSGPVVTAGNGVAGSTGLAAAASIFNWTAHPFNWNATDFQSVSLQMDYRTDGSAAFDDDRLSWTIASSSTDSTNQFGVQLDTVEDGGIATYWRNSTGGRVQTPIAPLPALAANTWYRLRADITKLTAASARIDVSFVQLDSNGSPTGAVTTGSVADTSAWTGGAPDTDYFTATNTWPSYKNHNATPGSAPADNTCYQVVTGTSAPRTLTVNVAPGGGGSVIKFPLKATYNNGESVQLTAVPATGYTFSNWSGDLTGNANPVTIVMDADKTITANFIAGGTVSFQYGASGYSGTIDTFIRGTTEGTTNFHTNPGLEWDDNSGTTTDEIALIRFTKLFSSEGGPIPDGATITSASLTYRTTDLNSGSTANGDPGNVYESLVDWPPATVTYNNFGGEAGVQTDEYRATPMVSAPATALSTAYTIDVTASLQRWSTTPTQNLGWIFLPTAADGVTIYSSDHATVANHPLLSVTYAPPPTVPKPPVVTVIALSGSNDVALTWDAVTQDVNDNPTTITSYKVYGSHDPFYTPSESDLLTPTPYSATTFTHTGGSTGTINWYYLVRAVNVAGESANSPRRTGRFGFTLVPGTAP